MSATAFLTQGPSIFDAMKDSCGYRPLLQIPASLHLICQGGTEDKANLVLGAVHRSRPHSRNLDIVLRGPKLFEASDPRDLAYVVASMMTAKFDHPSSTFSPNPSEEASVKIDYRLPMKSFYETTTICLMQKAQSVDAMFFAYQTRRQGSSQEEFLRWYLDASLLLEESVLDWL